MKEVAVNVRIEGISPLLMNKRPPEEEGASKKKGLTFDRTEDALKKAHFDEKIGFYVPCDMIQAAMREAGSKFKVGRGTAKKLTAYSLSVKEEQIPLNRKEYDAIDTRWGTHPSTGNSVSVSRVRFDKWALEFTLVVNVDRIELSMAKEILTEAGDICGIGSYKPANKSPGKYGRWKVTKWEVQEDK